MAAAVQALILVDLQTAFVAGEHAVPGAAALLDRAGELRERAGQAGSLIIQLQNDGPPGAVDQPGQPGWELYLRPRPGELIIRKTTDDGFHGTSLGEMLVQHRVSRIAIAGVRSEMCVRATAQTALERGFGVVLPHDAHASYDIPAVPGLADLVPAAMVSRVAEWALGDQVEVIAHAHDVAFTPATEAATPHRRVRPV